MKAAVWLCMALWLSGCSTIDPYVKKAKAVTVDAGKYIGLIDDSTMKVPDYYSTKTLPKTYRPGEQTSLDDLACEPLSKCE